MINEWIVDNFPEETILLVSGMENAFIGIAYQCNTAIAVYDRYKSIHSLKKSGMSQDEAEEYFSFNTQGSYMGAHTPAFLEKFKKPKNNLNKNKITSEQFTFNFNEISNI